MDQFSSERIYLIGYMASGKTTVGRLIADKLDFQHIDTDDAVTKLMGLSVNDIFKQYGETTFRSYELKVTRLITQLNRVVISSGGGLPVYNQNIDKLLDTGLTIYLKASVDTLVNRIIKDGSTRPLHNNQSRELLSNAITEKLKLREHIYSKAHLTLDTDTNLDSLVNQILCAL